MQQASYAGQASAKACCATPWARLSHGVDGMQVLAQQSMALVKLLKEGAVHLAGGKDIKSFTSAGLNTTCVRNAVYCIDQVSAYLVQMA